MNGPENGMHLFNFIKEQEIYMNETWFHTYIGRGCGEFKNIKKHSDDINEMNNLIASTMSKVIKFRNMYKAKAKANDYSNSYDNLEQFKFEKIEIGTEYESE